MKIKVGDLVVSQKPICIWPVIVQWSEQIFREKKLVSAGELFLVVKRTDYEDFPEHYFELFWLKHQTIHSFTCGSDSEGGEELKLIGLSNW